MLNKAIEELEKEVEEHKKNYHLFQQQEAEAKLSLLKDLDKKIEDVLDKWKREFCERVLDDGEDENVLFMELEQKLGEIEL